jgi:hypothetical protein
MEMDQSGTRRSGLVVSSASTTETLSAMEKFSITDRWIRQRSAFTSMPTIFEALEKK